MFIARRRDRPSETWVSPRAEWYDRNPTRKYGGWGNSQVAPHSSTQRWIYTVPAGKLTFVEGAVAMVIRDAAATTVGLATIFISVRTVNAVVAELLNNTVGTPHSMSLGANIVMAEGESISCNTSDGSTGGSHRYETAFLATEFTA